MPPRITAVRCPSQPCLRAAVSRPFSLSHARRALGPESPNYIEVPAAVQPTHVKKPHVKGVLPTPRNVFKTRSPLPKESPAFLQQSTPDPAKPSLPGKYSKDADARLYKQRLAAARKTALREGVAELHARKTTTEASDKAALQTLFAARREAALAPPREVDVLTQTAVSKDIRAFLADSLPCTSRSGATDARRAEFKRRMDQHQLVREARLHDLYTRAREFIVNEEQLDEAIDAAFGSEEQPVGWNAQGQQVVGPDFGKSPWAGPMPEGVAELLQKLKGGEGVGLAKERVKKVAEELTGGKM